MPGPPPPNLIQKLKSLRNLANRPGSAAEGEAAYRQATNIKARLMAEFGMSDQEVEAAVSDRISNPPPPPPSYPPPDPEEEPSGPAPNDSKTEEEPKRPKKPKKPRETAPEEAQQTPEFKVYKLRRNLFSADLHLKEKWEHTLMDYAARRAGCWLNSPLKSGVLVGTSQEDLEAALLFYTMMRDEILRNSKERFPMVFEAAFRAIGLGGLLSAFMTHFEKMALQIYLDGIAKGHEISRRTHNVTDDFDKESERSTIARKRWLDYINS